MGVQQDIQYNIVPSVSQQANMSSLKGGKKKEDFSFLFCLTPPSLNHATMTNRKKIYV